MEVKVSGLLHFAGKHRLGLICGLECKVNKATERLDRYERGKGRFCRSLQDFCVAGFHNDLFVYRMRNSMAGEKDSGSRERRCGTFSKTRDGF